MNRIITSIPSPEQGVWHLGPVPLRAYAFSILIGIFFAVWLGNRRWIARGGIDGQVSEVAMWAVPLGIIGGRVYHVATDWTTYFGDGGKGFVAALSIWKGGLGIYGALVFGAIGVWLAARKHQLPFLPLVDALAPGVALAQAFGRFGNYFNQELFGRPTNLPWGLEIDVAHRPVGYENFATFHPTFLYESLWCVGVMAVAIWADKRFTLGHGRVLALYVALYSAGRGVIETVRIDHATYIAGIRLNVFTALIIGALALGYFVWSLEKRPGRETFASEPTPQPTSGGRRRATASSVASDERSADSQLAPAEISAPESTAQGAQSTTQTPPVRGRRRRVN